MEHEEMTQLAEEVKFHPVIANRLNRRQVGAIVKAARMIQRRVAREAEEQEQEQRLPPPPPPQASQ